MTEWRKNLGRNQAQSGGSSPLARRTSSLFQLQQSQIVSDPLVTEHAAQLLVQALVISRLDYCNALLTGLPSNTIKPLQMIQNASSRAAWSSTSPCYTLFISLHWLPGAARIQFKTLMLAYKTTTGSAPTYYESTSPPEVWDLLVSDASWYHHREAQNHSPEHSHSPFLAEEIIFPSGTLDPCQSSSNNWKLISFNTTWKNKYTTFPFSISLSLSFSPSLASLYLFEQCLRLGVTSTSSVCSLYVFPNCKSRFG